MQVRPSKKEATAKCWQRRGASAVAPGGYWELPIRQYSPSLLALEGWGASG